MPVKTISKTANLPAVIQKSVAAGGSIHKGTGVVDTKLKDSAVKDLMQTALRIAAIDSQLDRENKERKAIDVQIKLSKVGKRKAQIAKNKASLGKERADRLAAFGEKIKWFNDNGFEIDMKQFKMIEGGE